MGVRRIFPGEGKNFKGARIYFLPKKLQKDTIFPQKSIKTYSFLVGHEGARAPLATPADAHALKLVYIVLF
jgi:hypothetical protein